MKLKAILGKTDSKAGSGKNMHKIITGKEQIAQRMGLSWPTVLKLYYQDGLPLMKVGLKWALDSEQLQAWLSRKSQCAREIRH